MPKEILDIYVEPGYEYPFNLNFDTVTGTDLEPDYSCYFKSASIGELQFTHNATSEQYELIISEANTAKVLLNLEEYAVYVKKTADNKYDKLLSGRIHIDNKIR